MNNTKHCCAGGKGTGLYGRCISWLWGWGSRPVFLEVHLRDYRGRWRVCE